MKDCDQFLAMSIADSCREPLVEGVEKVGIIINRDDVDFRKLETYVPNHNIVQEIPLKEGKKAYEIYQHANAFTGTNSTAVVGTYRNSTTHQVNFIVFDNGPEVAHDIIDPLFNGEFIIVLENKYKKMLNADTPGSSAFQVYGLHNGLRLSSATQEKYSEETGGGWNVVMEEPRAPKSAMFLYKTDYKATKTYLESLVEGKSEE